MYTSLYRLFVSAFLLFAFLAYEAIALGACYAPGPAFPKFNLTAKQFEDFGLRHILDGLVDRVLSDDSGRDKWNPNTTSFAIQITSGNETTWESYHTASILGKYNDGKPRPFSGDTAFRIASITKSFAVYTALRESNIELDDPITKYIPELLKSASWDHRPFNWNEITIRSLSSQLSGIGRGSELIPMSKMEVDDHLLKS